MSPQFSSQKLTRELYLGSLKAAIEAQHMTDIIRVELGDEIEGRGIWRYTCTAFAVQGRSRQPLLDACRQLKSMGADPALRCGLFRPGRSEPDLTCRVKWGAKHAVHEGNEGMRVRPFIPFMSRLPTS
jgi:hypothetical protein